MAERDVGMDGEDRAVRYLRDQGYRVLERNFRTRRGEIDIVAEDDERVVFVEVKNWRVLGVENLEQSIGGRKQGRICEASRVYLTRHPELRGRRIGYDVIFCSSAAVPPKHYKNAFDGV